MAAAPAIATAGFAHRNGMRRTRRDVLLFHGSGAATILPSPRSNPGPANIHIVHHAGKLMALGEHGEPFELDPLDLERGAFMNTGGKRTAHPKIDPETGEMVWFAYFAGRAVLQPDRLWRH